MKVIFTWMVFMFTAQSIYAQNTLAKSNSKSGDRQQNPNTINYNGQWKGGFNEMSRSRDEDIVYVLELETDGSRAFGYSYTYFREGANRYYTICRLTGTLNRQTKEIVVTEIERTKYNTPPYFLNCFQTHRLHYYKENDSTEILKGTWEPAPNQTPGCGTGITLLSRRIVHRKPLGITSKSTPSVGMTPTRPAPKKHITQAPKKTNPPIAKKDPVEKTAPTSIVRPKIENKSVPQTEVAPKVIAETPIRTSSTRVESRRNDIVKVITIGEPAFQLDFYDNGEIDGDSISVYYNGKLVLSNQMLTDKPLTIHLDIDPKVKENIVTMYAENLGTIPPNTAVMIVTDGDKRYEVRLESDLKKSGSVIFLSDK